jgi:hypothetical protein
MWSKPQAVMWELTNSQTNAATAARMMSRTTTDATPPHADEPWGAIGL